MNVTFSCPNCHVPVRQSLDDGPTSVDCPTCQTTIALKHDLVDPVPDAHEANAAGPTTESDVSETRLLDGHMEQCAVCAGRELYLRKDFSQRVGVTVVVVGILASCVTWAAYRPIATLGILLFTALLDLVLYLIVGNALQCYRCQAIYRGVAGLDQHKPFNLETHEKYRQMAARRAAHADQVGNGPDPRSGAEPGSDRPSLTDDS